MEPLYAEIRKRGYQFDAEHVLIHETPVQLIPAYNPLGEETVEQSVTHDYHGVPVKVIGAEHLAALAYQTGGRHRLARVDGLLEEGIVNREKRDSIMAKHGISKTGK